MATNTPVARVAALQGQVFAQDEKGNLRQFLTSANFLWFFLSVELFIIFHMVKIL